MNESRKSKCERHHLAYLHYVVLLYNLCFLSEIMNRSLGQGIVKKLFKKSAIIETERLGSVHFPLQAAAVTDSRCVDLRETFQCDDEVFFTASKQTPQQNGCNYVANSVVKSSDLSYVEGKISEVFEKYCYAEVKKYGRVFVPFSSRLSNVPNRSWLGKGCEMGKEVKLKVFRQPECNQCKYVAWSINIEGIDNSKTPLPKNEGVYAQRGVICSFPDRGDILVYSTLSGLSRVSHDLRKPWMKLGRFCGYDSTSITSTNDRVHWNACNITDLGTIYESVYNDVEETRLKIVVYGIVNRVAYSTRCAWLWNDLIGRVYVSSHSFVPGLEPMVTVKIEAYYTGAFEDVPWAAGSVMIVNDPSVREMTSQLLITDDGWVVKSVQSLANNTSYHGVIEHPTIGNAFFAWTDVNDNETPEEGNKCRATVYYQQRKAKHAHRAVLCTPLGLDGRPILHHPLHKHTGKLIMPKPIEPPADPNAVPSPIGVNRKKSESKDLKQSSTKSATNGNGVSQLLDGLFSDKTSLFADNPFGNGSNRMTSFQEDGIFSESRQSHLRESPLSPSNKLGASQQHLSDCSDSFSDNTSLTDLDCVSKKKKSSVDSRWTKQSADNLLTDFSNLGVLPSDTVSTGTQTDPSTEQLILRDILSNEELLYKVMATFPRHVPSLVNHRF